MRRWWAELQRAEQVYARRHELSGRETRDAAQALRWDGDRLRGQVLPVPRPR